MRKLFLVGSPRSGTTLLQTILTSQLELFTLKETHFFRHLHRWRPVRWLDRLQLDRARVDAAFRFITENNALEGSYDWAGVRRLADAPGVAGEHVVTWDGRDDSGRPTAAGVYHLRVTLESGKQLSKPLVVVE